MALEVEDGTGKANAESFISVADATAYHAARGNTAWSSLASDTIREQCLRKATDFMEQIYRLRWKGGRVNGTQALSWPREYVERAEYVDASFPYSVYYPSDEVPQEVKNACAELALRASADDLAPDVEQRVKREKVDVLEVEYDMNSPAFTQYRSVDNILAPLLKAAGSKAMVGLIRA